MQETNYENLSAEDKKLLDAAEEAMKRAYNPYSNFFVGAAILTKNGKIITGANVENAAYGSTACAEEVAILRAHAEGEGKNIKKIAVIAKGKDFDTKEVTAPCGCCRQILNEMAYLSNYDIDIILSTTKKDKIVLTKISELLPLSFSLKDLNM